MNHIKSRLLSSVMVVLSVALIYHNWHQLLFTHKYSMKLAAFAPLWGVGGLFLLAFPTMASKPNTGKEKFMVAIVFVIGLIVGLLNWYLMDPGFFRH
jgi:hypothetical protein